MRTLILGLDAFDPGLFENLYEQGRMPNLGKHLQASGYTRFQVSTPAQSEVSWTSIATGLNPGQHGIFDFVHRDPQSYSLYVSMLPTRSGLGGVQFVRPSNAKTIFDKAAELGFPATALFWPVTFPALPESPVRTLPGLGTPDIHGRLGVGTLFTTESDLAEHPGKTPALILQKKSRDTYSQELPGPVRKTRSGSEPSGLPLHLEILDEHSARLRIGEQNLELQQGVWSTIITLKFKLGFLVSMQVITRVILTKVRPEVRLYFLPLQLHPLKSPWRYGTPGRFVKQSWSENGPFLTIGWPQETTALEDGFISDEQFLRLCDDIFVTRQNLLMRQLDDFQEGLLAAVFDSLDRIQHMFWKDRTDIIASWYEKLDGLVGQVESAFGLDGSGDARLMVVSDHGFTNFDNKVHLNRWLIEEGYLSAKSDHRQGKFIDLHWEESRLYAVGLNSLYLNLAGREAKGLVEPAQRESLLKDISSRLLAWKDADGNPVIRQVWRNEQVFTGDLSQYGPDLVIGYAPGYRASAQTGLGGWESQSLEKNVDHWSADHCIDPQAVPGVLFMNRPIPDSATLSYRDFPYLSIDEDPDENGGGPSHTSGSEDQEVLEERLKSLGYL
jgi:predicted AlkP superfamily phosphohydrolase/phosphomutase